MKFDLQPVKNFTGAPYPFEDKTKARNVCDFDTNAQDFYHFISEKFLFAHANAVSLAELEDRGACGRELVEQTEEEIFALLSLMTACATRINALTDSPETLERLQKDVVDFNENAGYFTVIENGKH